MTKAGLEIIAKDKLINDKNDEIKKMQRASELQSNAHNQTLQQKDNEIGQLKQEC